ncbi:MAG: DRTGG domain-containing protein [Anaerolineales bacterium]
MTVQEIVEALELEVIAGTSGLHREVTGGYASDLLSCVIAGASKGNIWITLQAHPNIVAVADLLELSCIVVSEGMEPDEETLGRANESDMPILLSEKSTFTLVGELFQMGIRESEDTDQA